MVHLGLGAFHRAHQAMYTEQVLEGGDLRWGIAGVSLRSPAVGEALIPQDGLYSVSERDGAQAAAESSALFARCCTRHPRCRKC